MNDLFRALRIGASNQGLFRNKARIRRVAGRWHESCGPIVICLFLAVSLTGARGEATTDGQPSEQNGSESLGHLSLEQLGDVQVTTASKEPEQVWRTPAAIYVLTQDDIRRSGATSIPEALRLVPGVDVVTVTGTSSSANLPDFCAAIAL